MREKYANFRGITVEQVFRIEVNEGDGTPDDPIHRCIYWVDKNGNIIGIESPYPMRKFAGESD